ncbi:Cullin family-domain-containing protein [Lasiosphaeria hispida]|uniref:Cullin family-domain-containing protein n=1 Tax=Lasiosphaeria hispida TaxID=260671 RepID=A0AAJ0HM61_9PEZI|nr:Cullin family-domain-containing protein [Lasiosphaeria hispida]
MPSTTSAPPVDGPAQSPPESSSNLGPFKRRHRVDSDPDPHGAAAATAHNTASVIANSSSSSSSSAALPDPKRARSSIFTSPYQAQFHTQTQTMSAKVQGKRPETIDLTRSSSSSPHPHPSTAHGSNTVTMTTSRGAGSGGRRAPGLQPHMGPRKLVIKNFRSPTSARTADVDRYYERARAELDAALAAIFAGRPTSQPMEHLYRDVEDICRKGDAAPLADALRVRCEAYLSGEDVLGGLQKEKGGDDVALLRAVLAHWKTWSDKMLVVRWAYSYLDRSFLLGGGGGKTTLGINDMGITLFRKAVFGSRNQGLDAPLGLRVIAAVCSLVDYDRTGDDRFEAALLKEAVTMLRLFGVYGKSFETRFLIDSHTYFSTFAEERSVSYGLKDYIIACERLLQREGHRCEAYNFDSTTKRLLLADAHHVLVEQYSSKLLDSTSVARLLGANDVGSVKALYDLLKLSAIQKRLKGPWEEYIRATGSVIVSDVNRGDEMVIRLLELRRSLDIMIRDAFGKDDVFTYGLREAFGFFINDKKSSVAWNQGTSKVGEMIAKYIDMLLRGGLKTLPKTLLSDTKDRADAEMSGVASTGDEDAELDRQLDNGLELFRFIEGKDVFEAFYKKDLARRLLMGRSASRDAERNMLSKLKSECGSSFTHNLEQMFRDQELAKDEMKSYKDWLAGTGRAAGGSVDLSVSILSAAAWPTYPEVRVLLPRKVLEQISVFDGYYKNKHTGRRLTWKHNLAHCVVRAQFDRGPKELLVSAFQAVVLVLFNEVEGPGTAIDGVLSYEQIAQATGLPGPELERTLQSLACGKVRVLAKHPRGRDVKHTDTFTVNRTFTDPKYRVKINQIQLRETKEENKETHERVAADRQFETQAAIVRIMKSRKVMTHAQLVAEVINQTKSRGAVDAGDIKTNIEKLIEKDYLERENGSYTYLA